MPGTLLAQALPLRIPQQSPRRFHGPDDASCRTAAHASNTSFSICPEYWFPDGNITIIAGGCGFRVHRGLLERHSEVFRDMFALPSDVYYFLKALYDGVVIERRFPTDFAFIAAILRLSQKYFVAAQRNQCLALLARDYPTTLAEWDRREHSVTDPSGRYLPRDHIASPILVINLARELSLETLLPAAFYDLSRYGPSKTAAGTTAPPALFFDAYSRTGCDPPAPAVPVVVQDGGRASLAADDLVLLLAGREHGQSWLAQFLESTVGGRAPAAACTHARDGSRPCHDSFFFLLLNTRRAVGGIAIGRDADPLFTLRQMGEMLHRTDFSDGTRAYGLPMCCFCKADFVLAIARAREEVWRAIPAWFKLPQLPYVRDGDVRPAAVRPAAVGPAAVDA